MSYLIQTASSHHGRCFVCKSRGVLRRINPKSVCFAYVNQKILIKYHSRCCARHLDEHGIIRNEDLMLIPTTAKYYDFQTKMMLDSLEIPEPSQLGIFDRFKDMNNVTEEECFQITNWSKEKFIEFSKYIKNIKNSSGRTKEQLIALYRYWLRKGTDQESLALLKNKTSQRQISHYLEQIRIAINNEFVPQFLGAKKPRDFYLKHNNKTTIELHELKEDELAIVVDGTYTRIEKSSNNKFQYNSYSKQKEDSLIKPFIICCADGYFIDCFGPFRANQNDAQILDYILKTDPDLKNILLEEKTTIFLDRGFEITF